MNNSYKKKCTSKDLFLINKYLKKFKVISSNEHIEYIFKTKNYTITIYKNKTLLIQGTKYENILKMIDKNYCEPKKENEILILENIIGSDEVGTGDVFGGITVVAAYIKNENISYINSLNINDSKIFNNNEIKNLYQKIKDFVTYELVYIEPKEYNSLYEKYQNLNIIKTYSHNLAIKELIQKNSITNFSCVIDQFAPLNLYKKYLKNINEQPIGKEITIIKAESKYIQVAAASIIARYHFILMIEKLSQKANLNIPFGSVNKIVIPILSKLKSKNENLKDYSKLHFKTINKI